MSNAQFYGLPRDASESARLQASHRVFVDNMGFLLHPDIIEDLNKRPRSETISIADVATGTGSWPIEAAQKLLLTSKPQFTGFDISDDQLATAKRLAPSNVQFQLLDILDPIPQDLVGKFDVRLYPHSLFPSHMESLI